MANIGSNYLLRNYLVNNQETSDATMLDTFVLSEEKPLDGNSNVLDVEWVRSKYGISDAELMVYNGMNFRDARYFTTASYKYTSSKLGSHISCNPKPQYTRYADIRPDYNAARHKDHTSIVGDEVSGDEGTMGRYYSEAIDDNVKLVYFTFGTKRFNGLIDYFFSAIDYGDSITANTGKRPTFYNLGYTVGSALVFACFPITTLLVWGIKLISNLLSMNKSFDYYYMQPAMHVYWSSVNTIATHLAIELGLINLVFEKKMDANVKKETHSLGLGVSLSQDELTHIAQILGGDIFNAKTHYLDIYAVVVKPQLRYIKYLERRQKALEAASESVQPMLDDEGGIVTPPSFSQKGEDQRSQDLPTSLMNFQSYLDDYIKGPDSPWTDQDESFKIPEMAAQTTDETNKEGGGGGPSGARDEDYKEQIKSVLADTDEGNSKRSHNPTAFRHNFHDEESDSFFNKFLKSIQSTIHDGAQHAIFQVEYMGSVSESFSNDTGEIQSGSMLKAAANGMRDMKFSLAGGNMGMGFDLGSVIGAVKDFAIGGLNSITFGLGNVISTLLGDQYIDMPKIWTDSSVSLPGAQFNIKLRTPYGNVFSRYQNLYIPLSMLLAGTLPLSTGPASYTSPFLCSMHCQGVNNIKLGMITSLQITRGTTNLPYTRSSRPLGIDVSFTVTDFSNIVTAPVSSSIFADIFMSGYDDEGPLGRYIATIAGRDIQTFKYYSNRLGRRLARIGANIESALSPYRWGVGTGNAILAPAALFVQQGHFNINVGGLSSNQ